MTIAEACLWALRQNYHADRMNAAIHCAEVRYSPLTFRLAEALIDDEAIVAGDLDMFHHLMSDRGRYAEDPGR